MIVGTRKSHIPMMIIIIIIIIMMGLYSSDQISYTGDSILVPLETCNTELVYILRQSGCFSAAFFSIKSIMQLLELQGIMANLPKLHNNTWTVSSCIWKLEQ